MKKILLTSIEHYVDLPSGSARIAWDEARFLAAAGYEVWAVAACGNENSPEHEVRDDVHLLRYKLPTFSAFDPRRMQMHQSATRNALIRYIDGEIAIIHGHSPLQFEGALKVTSPNTCKVYTVHSPAAMELNASAATEYWSRKLQSKMASSAINRVERRCLQRADRVTALSEFTVNCLRKLHGDCFADKVSVCPGWVDLERYRVIHDREAAKRNLEWPTDVPVLFTLRRLIPRMGIDRLLHAMAILKARSVRPYLVVGGTGPLRGALEQLRNDLGLDSTVQFLGRVDDGLLPVLYGACDAFVLPTAELECFGLIALEALACGRPVLATPTGALPEILSDIEPKWLARETNAEAIATLIYDFVKGNLPEYPPNILRDNVSVEFSADRRLRELVTTTGKLNIN